MTSIAAKSIFHSDWATNLIDFAAKNIFCDENLKKKSGKSLHFYWEMYQNTPKWNKMKRNVRWQNLKIYEI